MSGMHRDPPRAPARRQPASARVSPACVSRRQHGVSPALPANAPLQLVPPSLHRVPPSLQEVPPSLQEVPRSLKNGPTHHTPRPHACRLCCATSWSASRARPTRRAAWRWSCSRRGWCAPHLPGDVSPGHRASLGRMQRGYRAARIQSRCSRGYGGRSRARARVAHRPD